MSNNDVFLAEGTYGKVYKCHDNTVKKYLNIFEYGTINELYMYLRYSSCPFIPKLLVVDIEKEKIILNMTYEGPTIDEYAKTIPYLSRISFVPLFINQFGIMARWLKERSIIHYDIKPTNICINPDTHVLKLIDFNFTIPTVREKFNHCGTYIYCDPSYKKKTKNHSIQFDIFSLGMCLVYWINKKDHDITKVKSNDELRSIIKMELYADNLGSDIMKIILSMINLDENSRIKAEDIPVLPIKSIENTMNVMNTIKNEEIKDERRKKIKLLIKKKFKEDYQRQVSDKKDPYCEWIIYNCLIDFESLGVLLQKNYDKSIKIIKYLCGTMIPPNTSSPALGDNSGDSCPP